MAQCLNCYGFVHIDNDGQTFVCRGMFTGECSSPNISDAEITQLREEREDELSYPEYREGD